MIDFQTQEPKVISFPGLKEIQETGMISKRNYAKEVNSQIIDFCLVALFLYKVKFFLK